MPDRVVGKPLVLLLATLLLASCVVVKEPVRVTGGQGWYTVKRSDTLYSIAWRYGLDYNELASWNGVDINAPIYPGQRLRLVQPASVASSVNSAQQPAPGKQSGESRESSGQRQAAADDAGSDPGAWIWPTDGEPLNTFLASQLDRRGIDIAGQPGQPVFAVADGRVVYSGNGLAGYGNLIIIKHSDTYLSAYAYCQERLVQEGAAVKAGGQIAKMGRHENRPQLHFEIRRNGKPVDPLKYLPKR
jgi:lipoprotein NlpD